MHIVIIIAGAIALFALFTTLFAIPTYFLWNWLMPTIFGLKTITFLQALGLNWLCGFLFKSFSVSKK